MADWEKFVVPDWVVDDRNRRLHSNTPNDNPCTETETPATIKMRQALYRRDMEEWSRIRKEDEENFYKANHARTFKIIEELEANKKPSREEEIIENIPRLIDKIILWLLLGSVAIFLFVCIAVSI